MKTLLILRHGKAEGDSPAGDKGRRLTPKGERDAAVMGERIAARLGCPDWVVASDATRARRTAELAARAAGFSGEVVLVPAIYDAALEDLLDVVQGLPDGAERVLLVGHNPGVALLGMALEREVTAPPAMTPATLVALSLDVAHWADVDLGCGRRIALLTPEHHQKGA